MFCVEKERENFIFTKLRLKIEKIALIGWQTITILRHEHLQARLLDSDFKSKECEEVTAPVKGNVTTP